MMMAVVALFATSCHESFEVGTNANETAVVSFSLVTPEIITRAYGDGTTATKLQYAIYDENGQELEALRKTDGTIDNKSAIVRLQLAAANTYSILFWASAPDAPYTLNFAEKTMTVDYTNVACNDENLDAFYAYYTFTVNGEQTETVSLVRPFSQLNIGATDFEASADSGYMPTHSAVTIENVYNTFNFETGAVGGEESIVEYKSAPIPTGETFPVAGCEYLAMNYVLVSAEKSLVKVTFSYTDGAVSKVYSVDNVPMQRNARSNIYGDILTHNVDVNVDIKPEIISIVSNSTELAAAVKQSGTVILQEDITPEQTIDVKAGVDVYLNLNGQSIIIDPEVLTPNSNGSHYAFIVREGGSLVIDGDGTVEATTPAPILFYPAGDVVIENGTFIRNIPEGYTGDVGSMFVGTKPTGGWHSTGVTINGGYFDCGYYPTSLADVNIEKLITGEETLVETESDKAKRGQPGDSNVIRTAIKNLISKAFNKSNNYFKVYGGTFVGANPAWGDEGCMLPTTPNYLRPWSYYQGAFLDGQEFNENGIVLPEGYTVTKGTHEDGRPTYTVTYSK